MSALDGIRERVEVAMDYPGHVTILESQTDVPRLLGALDAVLALADYWETLAFGDQFYASRIREVVNDALEADK